MDRNQVFYVTNDSLEGGIQSLMDEDDDHPPSTRRTQRCASNIVILNAWIRKA